MMATLDYNQSSPNEKTYILEDAQTLNVKNGQSFAIAEFSVSGDGDEEGVRLREGAILAQEHDVSKYEKSSLALTSFNYINSIVGSGVIGMPYALHQAGIGAGIILLLFITLITDASLVMMIRAGQIAEVNNFQDLSHVAFGKFGFLLQSLLQFLYPFISLITYNIVVGDTLTKVLIRLTGISPHSVVARREFILTAVTLLVTLPLSLYKNIARLAKVSLLSVLMIIIIAVAMIIRIYTMKEIVEPTADAWTFAKPNMASAIGIMSFAFMCHHSGFLVYDSLQDNTQQRWNRATHTSIGIAAVISLIYSVAGFVTFTGNVQGDIFENYCWKDDLMNFCRGFYALTILLTYPIECFVTRDVLEKAFFSQYQSQPIFRHAAITVIIAAMAFSLSLATDCLGIVLELNGIFCALPLAYILPPLCFIRLEEGGLFCRQKWIAWIVTIFGSVAMLAGIINLIGNYDTLSECSHGKQLPYCYLENNVSLHQRKF